MKNQLQSVIDKLKSKGITAEQELIIQNELKMIEEKKQMKFLTMKQMFQCLYDKADMNVLPGYTIPKRESALSLKTLEDLIERDKQREKDGFPRRIKIGKLMKPGKDKKGEVIIVPTTTEPKFYHDDSITEDEDETGGSGEGEEGEVIGEQQAQPQPGEGEGQGAGQGQGADHDIVEQAFDLGKVLTEKFQLPNLKEKGKKRSFSKYTYDLTDRNRGFGQVLEKKETLKKIIETNIQLGYIDPSEPINTEELLISPQDQVYRILSKEKDFETQAVVFFLRDYSGSMQGKPTDVVVQQHLFIYSWLMYQYQNNVQTRFILHDTEAKEVPDFYTYYQSQVAGGTKIASAFALALKIIEEERLDIDNNIYIFHGTDGDDWDSDGKETIDTLRNLLRYVNRTGITVAKNSWTLSQSVVEKYIEASGLLNEKPNLLRIDAMQSESATENRIIEGIKKLVS